MASFNYMNNTAPFWDFVANLERQGSNHPFFAQDRQNRSTENEHSENTWGLPPHPANPWTWGPQLFGGPGGLPHRGPPGPPPPPGPHGPPPPPGPHGPHGPPHHHHHHDEGHKHDEKNDHDHDNDNDNDNDNDGSGKDRDQDNGEGPSGSGSDSEGGRRCGRHGRCGGRRGRHGFGGRGGFGPHHRGPHHHGPPHHGRGGHHGPPHHGGGSWGRHDRSHPYNGRDFFGNSSAFDPSAFLAPLLAAFTAEHPANNNAATIPKETNNGDFVPSADIFDTPSSYIIHLSLPGARKEDVGVNWDADKSELSIAGVIYRPSVDEELLKMLSVSERSVGPFERKIRLGSRANPARVDAEGITAKLEDGVLRVEVAKEEEGGFVEVRKVDVE